MNERGERGGAQPSATSETSIEVSSLRGGLDAVLVILREATAIIDACDGECIHLQCGSKNPTTHGAMMSSTRPPPPARPKE